MSGAGDATDPHLLYAVDDGGGGGGWGRDGGAASASSRPCDVVHVRSKKHYHP